MNHVDDSLLLNVCGILRHKIILALINSCINLVDIVLLLAIYQSITINHVDDNL